MVQLGEELTQPAVRRGREGAHATLRPVERLVFPPGVKTDLCDLEEVVRDRQIPALDRDELVHVAGGPGERLHDRRDPVLPARVGTISARPGTEHRLPNTLSVSFVGLVGADILAALDGVAASTGSACHAGSVELSPVLRAMGISPEVGMGAIRFSLGRRTTEAEIRTVAGAIDAAVSAGVGRFAAPLAGG